MVNRAPEVKQLQALTVLAQELHFGRAAQRLNITQPALSQLIRDLENRLGFRLLERTTRRALLTDAGRMFLGEAEAILIRLERAVESARAEAGHAANSIRIGAILPTAFDFLPDVLAAFRRRYRDADIHIESRESPQLVTAVESGALHVALLRPPRNSGTLQIETLRREPFIAALPIDHPLAKAEMLNLADLGNERLVRIARTDLRDAFDELDEQLASVGLDLDQSETTEGTMTALALVSAGDGISLVPSWTAAVPWKHVCFRQVRGLTACIELSVAWEASSLPAIAEHFIDVARRTAAKPATRSRAA